MVDKLVKIPFKNRIITIDVSNFDEDINLDELTKIDYSNLYAEIITAPTLLNKIGFWRAQAEDDYLKSKLQLEIFKSGLHQLYRKNLSKTKDSRVTDKEVESSVNIDENYEKENLKVLDNKKNFEILDSLYWAIKDKCKKLDKISESMKLTPDDFEKEIIEGKINSVIINK